MSGSGWDLLVRTSISCGAVGVLSLLSTGSWLSLSLVDQVVLLGLAVVLPLVIGDLPAWWAMATALVALGFAFEPGVGALSVLPIVVTASAVLLRKLHVVGPLLRWDLPVAAEVLAVCYGVVAALSLLLSRSRITLFGLHEPIVELTAVHYTFAGAGALFLAARAAQDRPRSRLARTGVALTAIAPPLVALGFVTGAALPQVGGAGVMAFGVWITAAFELLDARTTRTITVRALLVISGLAVWIPMVLAVAWAAGQHWNIPALSIPDLARTHGLVNAIAFTLAGLAARRLPETHAGPGREGVRAIGSGSL